MWEWGMGTWDALSHMWKGDAADGRYSALAAAKK